jgi:hypothetical protein
MRNSGGLSLAKKTRKPLTILQLHLNVEFVLGPLAIVEADVVDEAGVGEAVVVAEGEGEVQVRVRVRPTVRRERARRLRLPQ